MFETEIDSLFEDQELIEDEENVAKVLLKRAKYQPRKAGYI